MRRVVSIDDARRILGDLVVGLTDNQIQELIYTLHLLAREQIVYNSSKDAIYSHEQQ